MIYRYRYADSAIATFSLTKALDEAGYLPFEVFVVSNEDGWFLELADKSFHISGMVGPKIFNALADASETARAIVIANPKQLYSNVEPVDENLPGLGTF